MVKTAKGAERAWLQSVRRQDISREFETLKARGANAARDGMTPLVWEAKSKQNTEFLNSSLRSYAHRFSSYELLLKSKGVGKAPREISRPSLKDRIALRCMTNFLSGISSTAAPVLAQDKIACVIDAVSSGKYSHFIKLDIINFYPSIRHEWIQSVLRHHILSEPIVQLYMQALQTPSALPDSRANQRPKTGVPQGLSISNAISELAVSHLDRQLEAQPHYAYFRFVDDILILMPKDESSTAVPAVSKQLSLAGLAIHPVGQAGGKSAVGDLKESFEYLGYRFIGPRVTVRPGSVQRVEKRLSRAFTGYKYARQRAGSDTKLQARAKRRLQWHVNLAITGCRFEGKSVGWLSYFSQIRHHQLLHHLDSIVLAKAIRFQCRDVEFKTFVKAYRFLATKRIDGTGYVPNFDTWPIEDKRGALLDVFGVKSRFLTTDEAVTRQFSMRIRSEVKDLERDVESEAYR
jgi:RNA-directed DNA polymerase